MLSAYRIGGKTPRIWMVRTQTVAESELPQTLPMSSIVLSFDEARALAEQILAAIPEQYVPDGPIGRGVVPA